MAEGKICSRGSVDLRQCHGTFRKRPPLWLCCVNRNGFEDHLLDSTATAHLFMARVLDGSCSNFLEDVDSGHEWMLLLERKTAQEKVASLILMMSQRLSVQARQLLHRGRRSIIIAIKLEIQPCRNGVDLQVMVPERKRLS
jgi:hypothetical protein